MSLLRPNIPLCLWCGRGEGIHQMAKRLPRPIANKSPIANHPPWNSKCLPVHPTTKITTQDEEQVWGKHHRNAKPIPNSPKTIPNLFFRGNRNHHSQNKCKKKCVTVEWKTHYSNTDLPSCQCCSCRSPQCPSYFAPGKNGGREVANRLWLGSSIYGIRHLGDILTRD